MKTFRRVRLSLVLAGVVALTGCLDLRFPRLGGMLIGNPHNFHEPAFQAQIARLHMAVLGMYDGWSQGGKTPAQVVAEIKARNPQILLGNYTLMTEVSRSAADTAQTYKRNKLNAELGPNGVGDWWAYDAAGHTDWSGGTFGSWDTNLTLFPGDASARGEQRSAGHIGFARRSRRPAPRPTVD